MLEPGTIVVCMNDSNTLGKLTFGNKYVIRDYNVINFGDFNNRYCILDDEGIERYYFSDRFVSLDKIRDKKIEMLLWE